MPFDSIPWWWDLFDIISFAWRETVLARGGEGHYCITHTMQHTNVGSDRIGSDRIDSCRGLGPDGTVHGWMEQYMGEHGTWNSTWMDGWMEQCMDELSQQLGTPHITLA